MFSVDTIKNTFNKTGVTKGNKYALEIVKPVGMVGIQDIDLQDIRVRINSVELPGKQVATSEVKYYGPLTKRPYGQIFEDLTCEIICSANLIERRFFSHWMDFAYDPVQARAGYYQEYVTQTKFKSFGEHGGEFLYECTFDECHPISIGPLNYAYGNEDLLTMQVTFAYKKWYDQHNNFPSGGNAATGFDAYDSTISASLNQATEYMNALQSGLQNLSVEFGPYGINFNGIPEIPNIDIHQTLGGAARSLSGNLKNNAKNSLNNFISRAF